MSNPYAAPAPSGFGGDPGAAFDIESARPLYNVKGWIKLIAILQIIQGVCGLIFIVGILPLWIGILLNSCSNLLAEGFEQQRPAAVQEGVRKLATVIKIMGILTLIFLVLFFMIILLNIVLGVAIGVNAGN